MALSSSVHSSIIHQLIALSSLFLDLDVQINSTDTQITGIFTLHYISVLTVLPNFCTFGLFVSVQLDYEDRSEYLFNVTARNTQGIITVAMVTVQVIGQNEYAPVITPSM